MPMPKQDVIHGRLQRVAKAVSKKLSNDCEVETTINETLSRALGRILVRPVTELELSSLLDSILGLPTERAPCSFGQDWKRNPSTRNCLNDFYPVSFPLRQSEPKTIAIQRRYG
jgi:hypothetical protein